MNNITPLSRTATALDREFLNIDNAMRIYAEIPKEFDYNNKPRYRFWDYALVLKLQELENIKSVLDIAPTKDVSFKVIAEHYGLEINQVFPEEGLHLPVIGNKYDMVTCFGVLEYVPDIENYFLEYLRHVRIGGYAIFTTDNESSNRIKRQVITTKILMDLSLLVEDEGYELYGQVDCIDTDYNTKLANGLHSLIINRTGRW